jgi:hypothetical protein
VVHRKAIGHIEAISIARTAALADRWARERPPGVDGVDDGTMPDWRGSLTSMMRAP